MLTETRLSLSQNKNRPATHIVQQTRVTSKLWKVRANSDAVNRLSGGGETQSTNWKSFSYRRQCRCSHTIIEEAVHQKGFEFWYAETTLGLLISMSPTVPLGWLQLRSLQQQVITQMKRKPRHLAWIPMVSITMNSISWLTSKYALSAVSSSIPRLDNA